LEQAMTKSQQHALAGSVRPEDHGVAAVIDLQCDVVDDRPAARGETERLEGQRQQRRRALPVHP
jgi:hypothetical protein